MPGKSLLAGVFAIFLIGLAVVILHRTQRAADPTVAGDSTGAHDKAISGESPLGLKKKGDPSMAQYQDQGSRDFPEVSHSVHKSEEIDNQDAAGEPLPEWSAEDEAALALSQEAEPPTPLGPDFGDQLTTPDADTLRLMALHEALYESPGFVLARWQGSEPFGPMGVKGYRVEQVSLPHDAKVEIDGKAITVFMASRVTITGGPFPLGALPLMVWVDDTLLGTAQPSPDLSSISAVTFDDSMLHEGASLAISYGEDGPRTVLPRPLRFGAND